jgi:uracil-DNA glycosylase
MEEGILFKAFSEQASADWKLALLNEFSPSDFSKIEEQLRIDAIAGVSVYPPVGHIFRSLTLTPLKDVKCVILGQDPYHQPNQAMGLSFSVPLDAKIPPSLRNIFKELEADLVIETPINGDLTPWACQGVLLLNSILTVSNSSPLSHQKLGWEQFVETILTVLSIQNPFVIFVLWGKSAQRFADCIDESKHLIIRGVHPSPLSAHRGFLGSKPFSKINNSLVSHGISPIDWRLNS